jgi:hypothetical protein
MLAHDYLAESVNMQNIEALYTVEFGDVAGPGYTNGGVAVLETNRVFGGDSGYYYLGKFAVAGLAIAATIEVVKHDPTWRDAFGDKAQRFSVKMSGTFSGDVMTGQMERLDKPGSILPIRMTRRAPLP